jgi:hypothetical protein
MCRDDCSRSGFFISMMEKGAVKVQYSSVNYSAVNSIKGCIDFYCI